MWLTKIHYMITTDSTIINYYIYKLKKEWKCFLEGYSEFLPHDHKATAFHYWEMGIEYKWGFINAFLYLFYFKSFLISYGWSWINIHTFSHLCLLEPHLRPRLLYDTTPKTTPINVPHPIIVKVGVAVSILECVDIAWVFCYHIV